MGSAAPACTLPTNKREERLALPYREGGLLALVEESKLLSRIALRGGRKVYAMAIVAVPSGQIIGKFDHPSAAPRTGAIDTMKTQFDRNTGEQELHFMVEDRADDGKVQNYLYCVAKGEAAQAVIDNQWQVVALSGSLRWNRTSKFLTLLVDSVNK